MYVFFLFSASRFRISSARPSTSRSVRPPTRLSMSRSVRSPLRTPMAPPLPPLSAPLIPMDLPRLLLTAPPSRTAMAVLRLMPLMGKDF